MKILFVSFSYIPAAGWGGPFRLVQQHALEMQRRGHEVTIVASNLNDKKSRIRNGTFSQSVDNIDVHYLHVYNLSFWPGTLGPAYLGPSANRKLKELIAESDVVHVNGLRNIICVESMKHANSLGIPFVLQPHGVMQYIVSSIRIKKTFDALVLAPVLTDVKAYIALQEAEREQIILGGADPDIVYIVPNGIDIRTVKLDEEKGQFREKFGISEDKWIVLFMGRINAKKGVDLLVEAFAVIPEEVRQDLQLVIAGPDDGHLQIVEELITRYELEDQVTIPGILAGEDVWRAYADCDLFVLPCRTDTFPMAIVEACAVGKPMVVTETCEIADLIDDKAALIVPVDVQSISSAMTRLFQDENERSRLEAGTSELIKTTFSVEAIGDALESIYKKAVGAQFRSATF